MTPDQEPRRTRQKGRATIMAIALFAFVILIYFISIAKMAIR
jgi:hypothetical protein